VAVLSQVKLPPDWVLFREGETGDTFYIVLQGQVEVIKALGTAEERPLAVMGPGEWFGEMSLLHAKMSRTATVRTLTETILLSITRRHFDELLRRHPVFGYEMLRRLSSHLHDTNEATIRDLENKNRLLTRAYDELRKAQHLLIEKEKLERELELAREIQQSMVPRTLPRVPGLDFGVFMLPARAVGGDFFDFILLDASHLGIAV
jgi:phosphoserine phosphatase RsbU/P